MALQKAKTAKSKLAQTALDEDITEKKAVKAFSIVDFLRYKGLTQDRHAYIMLRDGTYADFRKIRGIGLEQLSDRQVKNVTSGFTRFLRTFLEDTEFIVTKFPTDTAAQQQAWGRRYAHQAALLRRTTDPDEKQRIITRQRYIKDKIYWAKQAELKLNNQEYIVVLFGKTTGKLTDYINNLNQRGGTILRTEPLSRERKKLMLFRLNNMNTKIG